MNFGLVALMMIILAVLLTVYKKRETIPQATGIVLGCFAAVVVCCFFFLKDAGIIGDKKRAILINEQKFRVAVAHKMCKVISENHKGGKVLILTWNAFDAVHKRTSELEYIQDCLTQAGLTPVVEHMNDLSPQATEEEMYMGEDMVTLDSFKNILKKHGDIGIVLSLVDLPYDQDPAALKEVFATGQSFYFLSADLNMVAQSLLAGLIKAVSVWRPGVRFSREEAPDDIEQAFEMRYVIATKENVADYIDPEVLNSSVSNKVSAEKAVRGAVKESVTK